jgi:MFS family permease
MATPPAETWQPAKWRELFRGSLGPLTGGLLLLEAVVAAEALIVTTVLPAVEKDLGGIQYYGWAFAAGSLATFATIPLAGRATDRYGPARPLGISLAVYIASLVGAALTPSMPILVLMRFIQGCGGGGIYSVSLGAVAKAYPERLWPRVFALQASMWILPGLAGPPLGALIASTIGWRWAFVVALPFIAVSAALILPPMAAIEAEPNAEVRLPIRWPVLLMIGAGLFLAGATELSWWSILLLPVGLAIGLPALARVTPPGTLRARRGLGAAAVVVFLLSVSFGAAEGFIPLMLTKIRGLSLAEAGVVVTLVTIGWSVGNWWESRVIGRLGAIRLVILGVALVAAGIGGGWLALYWGPIVIPYIAWSLAGVGMGVSWPTLPLAVMSATTPGSEASELSATALMDNLGIAVGAGLGGASVAIAHNAVTESLKASLQVGLAGAFGLALLAAVAIFPLARRLPSPRTR